MYLDIIRAWLILFNNTKIADECPVQGNPLCAGQIIHFDLGTSTTFNKLAPSNLGVILENIRYALEVEIEAASF